MNAALLSTDIISAFEQGLAPKFRLRGAAPASWTLEERMAHYKTPGLSLAVIVAGRIAWAKAYGLRQAGNAAIVDTKTIFQAASISKPVAAVTALRLVEKGLLDLDAPLNAHLLKWFLPGNAYLRENSVTLRHLLSHSGGVNVHGYPGYPAYRDIPSTDVILRGVPPANTPAASVVQRPGKAWRYSGGGYTILQRFIEDVIGLNFSDVVQELILDPAGMTESTFEPPLPGPHTQNSACAHVGSQSLPVEGGAHIYPELAAAGLWSTPMDLAKFALAVTDGPQPEQNLLLGPAMRSQFLSRQAGDWGLGVQLIDAGDGMVFRHAGGNHGYRADWFAYEDGRGGVAVMTNADQGEALIREVLASVAAVYGWRYQATEEREPTSFPQAFIDDITGLYKVPAFQEAQLSMEIVYDTDGFWVTIENLLPRTKFYPAVPKKLFAQSGIEMKARFDEKGVLLGFDLGQGIFATRLYAGAAS